MLELVAGQSIGSALSTAAKRLTAAGVGTPRLDAELLLAAALGVTRTSLLLGAEATLGAPAAVRFEALVARRAAREPVAYILGEKGFRRLSLTVDPRVLIPRPETELLVEVALDLDRNARVADVGTGSGAVALALKDERPDLHVSGSDVSDQALAVARGNAQRLGLDVDFLHGELLVGGPYDAVLANLPYVVDGDRGLSPEITLYEPPLALYGGSDGLQLVRRLVGLLARVAFVGLEVGAGQARAVSALLAGAGFGSVELHRDLAGHDRVVVGRR